MARGEIAAANCLMKTTHAFFDAVEQERDCTEVDDIAIHMNLIAFMSNTTNAGIWQRRALSTCMVHCENAWVSVHGDGCWAEINRFADILTQEQKCGLTAISMCKKHLQSLNCPSVLETITQTRSVKPH